jgi:uncharacterized membrane protein YedE/YeeE
VIETLLDRFGDGTVLLMAGLVTGLLFGVAAQRSQFCLRASTVELARGQIGARMSIWLIVFATALASTQALILSGVLNVSDSRQLSGAGSMSGAIIGGVMFGVGMVLARGCASRLLVLVGHGKPARTGHGSDAYAGGAIGAERGSCAGTGGHLGTLAGGRTIARPDAERSACRAAW